jgi:hypothetical protein
MRTLAFSPVVLCCVLAACSTRQPSEKQAAANSSAVIIPGSEITGSALSAIRTRIPAARISTSGTCPRIEFRGARSLNNQPDPSVYIDGTLMGDSCALNSIFGGDIERIEVYPSGDTPHANIRRNPSGIILIFRLRG